jgi:hypothetical protein
MKKLLAAAVATLFALGTLSAFAAEGMSKEKSADTPKVVAKKSTKAKRASAKKKQETTKMESMKMEEKK